MLVHAFKTKVFDSMIQKISEIKVFTISLCLIFFITYFMDPSIYSNFKNQIIFFSIPLLWPGLAHGSLDLLTAQRKKIVTNLKKKIFFLLFYILIALIFFYLWTKFCNLFFLIFLIISFIHFGIDDKLSSGSQFNNISEILIRGGIIILVPIEYHFPETEIIFKTLLASEDFLNNLKFFTSKLYILLFFLFIFWSGYNLFHIGFKFIKDKILFEIITLYFCFYYFEPLISFFTYFCFFHSIRHINHEMKKLDLKFITFFFKTIPFTLLTIIFFILIYAFFQNINPTELIFSYILVGLASLTIPHIILVNFLKDH